MAAGDLLASMLSVSWSASLFGARQAGSLVSSLGTLRPLCRVTEAFDAVDRAAEEELGETFGGLARTGRQWQSAAVDAFASVAEPVTDTFRSLASLTLVRGTLHTGLRSFEILDAASSGRFALAFRELANKLAAFEDFQYAHRILDLAGGEAVGIREALDRARELGSYRRLWALEGLGYAVAEAARSDGRPPLGRFAGRRLDSVPESSWLPLHTGLGLSLARGELSRFDSRRSAAEIGEAVARFTELAESNARRGYTRAVFESLGLVLRQLDPETLETVDRELVATDPERAALLWHGVGRGLYFLVSQAWPGSLPRAFALARREGPHALGRRNTVAGLAWAVTMVNFQSPEVLEDFLEHHLRGWTRADEEAFSHGLSSAVLFWFDAAGADLEKPSFKAFRDHRPAASNDVLKKRWERLVTAPCEAALARHTELKESARLDEIFRDVGEQE